MAVALLAGACLLVGQTFGAESEGTKKPPKANVKQFDIVTLASGFRKPTSVDWLPDGTMLVSEKRGRLWSVDPSGEKKVLLDFGPKVDNSRERGMGSIDVASDFATSGRVYVSYVLLVKPEKPSGPQAMRVSYIRLTPDGRLLNPEDPETVIFGKDATRPCPAVANNRDCPPSINATHQGGQVLSDKDGTVWVGWGDNNLPSNLGKHVFRTFNPASTAGKILHVDAEGRGLPDHPFCPKNDDLTDTCTKVFAVGLRNPFRFSLTHEGIPIVSDVGWDTQEEIDLVKSGRNYGWPCFEGKARTPFYRETQRCHKLYASRKKEKVTRPIYAYRNPNTGAGAAVIIGPQYPGGPYPDGFDGSFFFGDYARGFIKLLSRSEKGPRVRSIANGVTPVHMSIGPSKNLVFVDYLRGTIRELIYAPANKAPRPVISANPSSGLAPLDVQFSSAGTADPEGDPLTYDWDFGDGSPHSAEANPTHQYTVDGTFTVRLRVTDPSGGTAQTTAVVTVGNRAPTATITAPAPGTESRGGQPVLLGASGTDPEDGDLPSSAFRWDITVVHKGHEHPLSEVTGASAAFRAVSDHDADSYFEIDLTVVDSQGLATTLPTVVVRPETVPLRIASNLKGVRLSYGGKGVKAPRRVDAAIGYRAPLSAPETVIHKGVAYRFAKWSQGGKRVQIHEIPDEASTVKAKYKRG